MSRTYTAYLGQNVVQILMLLFISLFLFCSYENNRFRLKLHPYFVISSTGIELFYSMVFYSHLWTLPKYPWKRRSKMLKSASGTLANVLRRSLLPTARVSAVVPARRAHGGPVESDEEFDCRLGSSFWRYYVTENDNNPSGDSFSSNCLRPETFLKGTG